MTNVEYKVDKTGWDDGPWMAEPDRVDFVYAGFACFALRHPRNGNWCGYVGVPREHPLYGKDYTELPEGVELEAHMGVNYSAPCDGALLCHVPEPGMPADVWWFGFDLAHAFDLCPALIARELCWSCQTYKDLAYCRREIVGLAEQLAAMA